MRYRIGHIGVTVSDIEQSIEFYTSMFDLEVFARGEGDVNWIGAGVGVPGAKLLTANVGGEGIYLELLQYARNPGQNSAPRNNDVGAHHVCFNVDDVDAAYDELVKKGARFLAPPAPPIPAGDKREWGFAYLLDPDDISVEILQLQNS